MILFLLLFSIQAWGGSLWLKYSSAPYDQGAFPDTNVTYYRYAFQWPSHAPMKMRIRGQMPFGRYMTFNVYDRDTRTSLGSFPDSQILSETNPLEEVKEGESYSVWLTSQHDPSLRNQLVLPGSSDQVFEIWYRIYLPEGNEWGGVELPILEFFEGEKSTPSPTPPSLPPLLAKSVGLKDFKKLPPRPTSEGDVYFYSAPGFEFYNNQDNQYLVSRLDFSKGKDFLLLSFKSPRFGKTKGQIKPEVRYFSFCLGSAKTTQTSHCISDQEFILQEETSHLLIGPHSKSGVLISEICRKLGINFLPRGKNFIPLLIYRNVLPEPDFKGKAHSEFAWPPSDDKITKEEAAHSYAQHHHIGSYSPIGKQLDWMEAISWIESTKSRLLD